MILEILFTLASAASGTLIYKKMGGFGHIKARVTALLPEPEKEPSFSTPERVLPYSQKLLEDARHMGDILSNITHIMMKEHNPLWNRYTSVTARFNLMLNSHHDEDAFLHLTQEKRKFFSVFIPQVLNSLDFDDYANARDKSKYMDVFQQIYDYCLEIVTYYEDYQITKNDTKLLSIQQAIVASKDEPLALSTPAPRLQTPSDSQLVLSMEHVPHVSMEFAYHEGDYGLEVRIRPKSGAPAHFYLSQLSDYLDDLFKDKDTVRFTRSVMGKEIAHSYDLVNSHYSSRHYEFEVIRYPVSYYLPSYMKHALIDENVLLDIIVIVHTETNKVEFFFSPM